MKFETSNKYMVDTKSIHKQNFIPLTIFGVIKTKNTHFYRFNLPIKQLILLRRARLVGMDPLEVSKSCKKKINILRLLKIPKIIF